MTFSSGDLEGTDCQKRCLAKDLSVLINNFPNVTPAGQFGKQAVGLAGSDSGWSLYTCFIELSTWCIHCAALGTTSVPERKPLPVSGYALDSAGHVCYSQAFLICFPQVNQACPPLRGTIYVLDIIYTTIGSLLDINGKMFVVYHCKYRNSFLQSEFRCMLNDRQRCKNVTGLCWD